MTVTGVGRSRTHRRVARSKRDVLTALSAAATLLTLVVGVPIALVATTGWPWPAHIPTADQIGRDLLRPDDGHLLATTLVFVAWIAWLLFASGTVVETVGHVRGTLPRRLPVISPLQQLVAPLVAAVAILMHSPATSLAFAAPSVTSTELAPARPVAATIPAQPHTDAAPEVPPKHPSVHARELRLYVVRPAHDGTRDTLWSIAANHLGDPLRWHEIADLNHGRTQPDGDQLTDPHWIRPGWQLLMPPDATNLPLAEPIHPNSARSGQPPASELAPSPRGDMGGREIPQPSVITPPGDEEVPPHDRTTNNSHNTDDTEPLLPVGITIMGVLAAGLLTILGRRRAVQRRHRRDGEEVSTPPADVIRTETRLRVAADAPRADTVAGTLRALAAVEPRRAGHVQSAELTDQGLELQLDEPVDAATPFVAVQGGRRWRLDRSLAEAPDGHSALPALASIGHRDGRLVFVDLELLHVLYLTGDENAANQLLSWIAADLAAGEWAITTNLTLVGVAPPLAALDNERIRRFDHLTQDVVDTVESQVREFATAEHADAIATRTGDPLEPWPVEIVLVGSVAASNADTALIDQLIRSAQGDRRNGAAIVMVGDPRGRGTSAVIEDGRIQISALSIEADVAQLTDDEVGDFGRLVDAACDLESEPARPTNPALLPYPSDQPPTAAAAVTIPEPPPTDDDLDAKVAAYLAADPTVLRVQLLGPVTVNAPGPLEQKRVPTSTELIAYLACSPHGATLADVDEVLWPERLIPKHTRNNVIYRARTWAGRMGDDQPRLTRVDRGRLHLRDALVDWQLFERLVARAGRRQGSARTQDLRHALSLVRGKPFESVPAGRYAWLAGRNLEEHMSAVIIDTAHALAAELLEVGEAQAARDVARSAQLVDRHDERPWRDLLRAEAALGRPRKVREHIRSLMQILDVEVTDELMPETAELISQLLASEPKVATA
jgi:DNA-binding SARP family transcriptional activator